jgi:anaerobic ribonucleoside-triphosphate reductase activating protein
MRYLKIEKNDISNGPGIRLSIFVSGCDIHCPGCFNKESWDYNSGEIFNKNDIFKIFEEKREIYQGISILGGDPLSHKNISETLSFCSEFRERFPEKTIWVWTGRLFEEIEENLNDIDVLIDGPFIQDLYDPEILYRGSSNQRIIEIRKGK